jgi:signal transduction histidine kinase
MDWSNWVYLGVGVGLGVSFGGFFARTKVSSNSYTVQREEQQDFSALQQQIKQTQLAYHMAQEMSQFKQGFLARTTHVLRSPLNGLIGLHQLILSNLCENPEEEREFINQAHDRALKLLKLIDDILTVARIEHGVNKLNIQPQSLAHLLQEVYELTYMLAENRNFPFNVLPADPQTYILADPWWLRQVLINLVDICILQMEEGKVSISSGLSPNGDLVHIWLDVPTYAVPLSEPIDLMTSVEQPQQMKDKVVLPPGMKLILCQTLLEVMGGKLEILSSAIVSELSEHVTRLQLSLPRATPQEIPEI